jgi:hypothetical protein
MQSLEALERSTAGESAVIAELRAQCAAAGSVAAWLRANGDAFSAQFLTDVLADPPRRKVSARLAEAIGFKREIAVTFTAVLAPTSFYISATPRWAPTKARRKR